MEKTVVKKHAAVVESVILQEKSAQLAIKVVPVAAVLYVDAVVNKDEATVKMAYVGSYYKQNV